MTRNEGCPAQTICRTEEVKIVTYVDVGWPDQTPAPPYRLGLAETVLRRI